MLPPVLASARLALPVIGAPLFIISQPELVIAQCSAGVIGAFPSLNARPAEMLDVWLTRIRSELAAYDELHPERPTAPFAVNLIVHKSNDRLAHDLEACVKHRVPIVITSLGADGERTAVTSVCSPRYASITAGSRWIACGGPSASLRPESRTTT